jgi:hypothetical protein
MILKNLSLCLAPFFRDRWIFAGKGILDISAILGITVSINTLINLKFQVNNRPCLAPNDHVRNGLEDGIPSWPLLW